MAGSSPSSLTTSLVTGPKYTTILVDSYYIVLVKMGRYVSLPKNLFKIFFWVPWISAAPIMQPPLYIRVLADKQMWSYYESMGKEDEIGTEAWMGEGQGIQL